MAVAATAAAVGPSTSASDIDGESVLVSLSQHFRVCDDPYCSKILDILFAKENPQRDSLHASLCSCLNCLSAPIVVLWKAGIIAKLEKIQSSLEVSAR